MDIKKLSRREFVKFSANTSGGLILGCSTVLSSSSTFATPFLLPQETPQEALALNLFVQIGEDDKVYIVASRSEMGQGIRTTLPQVVADELDASWEHVVIVQGQGNEVYGNQNTDGSQSVRDHYVKMRQMGASAKLMLRQAAAKRWGVSVEQCYASNHRVRKVGTEESFRYGELAKAASTLSVPKEKSLVFKSPDDFSYIGRGISIVDMDKMVSGGTVYGTDVQLPGMLFASIEHCPFLGGKVKKVEAKEALKVAGVVDIVTIEGGELPAKFHPIGGVAVVATNTWAAFQGRKKLKITWEKNTFSDHNSAEYVEEMRYAIERGQHEIVRKKGDINEAFAKAEATHERTYHIPYLVHAPMEPMAATAITQKDRIKVWASTQAPQGAQKELAERFGIDKDKVFVNVTLLGGGFGRKSKPDFILEAAEISKAMDGKPVRLMWSREDDIQNAYYHAVSLINMKAGWDKDRNLTAFRARACYPPIASTWGLDKDRPGKFELEMGLTNTPFNIPNEQVETAPIKTQTRIGWMRSVCNIQQAFAVGSFIDELARKNQSPPLDYWLKAIGPDRSISYADQNYEFGNYGKPLSEYPFESHRLKHVLKQVVSNAGADKKPAKNEGWGIACHYSFLTHVAIATHVVLEDNNLRVKQVHCVVDCGLAVNPDRVKSQMEGAVIFGLSAALMGEISFKEGRVEQSNFHDYPVLRMSQTPDIHIDIVSSQEAPRGVGEPGVPPLAPSLTNAIVAAGGKRIYELPVSKVYQV